MPANHAHVTVDGQVTDVFAHRFVLATANGKVLADLGPQGAERLVLAVGDKVAVAGERKPSEIKVHALTRDGETTVLRSETDKPDHDKVDPGPARAAVTAAGFEPVGPAKRKPKHFEILGRRGDEHVEFHVGFDGAIRKSKAASAPGGEARS